MSLSSATSDPTSVLESIVQNVPADQNPFEYLSKALEYAVRPGVSRTYETQLHVLSGVVAFEAIVLFLSVAVRCWRGTFWLFRIHRPSNVILPHYVNGWSFMTAIGLALVQGYIWVSIDFIEGKGNDKSYAGWITLVWIPDFLAFWFACWSLCVSHALHLESAGKKTKLASAKLLNTFGLGVALAFSISIAVVGGLSDKHWREAIDEFAKIARFLAQGQQSWTPGTALTTDQRNELIALLGSFSWHYNRFVNNFQRTWIVFFVFGFLLEITFITVATLHLNSLKRMLREISKHSSKQRVAQTSQEVAVRKTYQALVFITVLFGVIFALFGSLFLFVTIRAPEVAAQSKEKEAASLMGVYLLAVPCFPLSLFLLFRSFERAPTQASADDDVTQLELTPSKADGYPQDSLQSSASHSTALPPAQGPAKVYEQPSSHTPSVLSYPYDDTADGSSVGLTSTPSPAPYPSRTASSFLSSAR